MSILIRSLVLVIGLLVLGAWQARPVSPGRVEAARRAAEMNRETPVNPVVHHASAAELQHQADELARLSQQIPGSIQQVNQNMLPKDLDANLKKIEGLAKKLRNELRQ